jgi:hypothetical protein
MSLADRWFAPKDIWQALFYPFYFAKTQIWASERPFRELRWAVVFALLGAAVAARLLRRGGRLTPEARMTLWFFTAAYLGWQWMAWEHRYLYRFLVGLEVLAPAVILILSGYLLRGRVRALMLAAACFAAITLTARPLYFGRYDWEDSYFGVEAPALEDPSRALILSGSPTLAMSYLIPFFPKEARFVRVQSNLVAPDSRTGLARRMREAIESHGGDLYYLGILGDRNNAAVWLEREYGLRFTDAPPQPVQARIGAGHLALWRLVKAPASSG